MVETSQFSEDINKQELTNISIDEQVQSSEIPIFGPDTVKLEEHFSWWQLFSRLRGTHKPRSEWKAGTEKRVAFVTVTLNGQDVPAALKLMRPYYQDLPINPKPFAVRVKQNKEGMIGGEYLSNEKRSELAHKDYTDTLLLNQLCPAHFPKPLGIYNHGRHWGSVMERVMGSYVTKGISGQQFMEFDQAMDDLINQNIFLDQDALSKYNLMVGSTASNPKKRILSIEANVVDEDTSEDTKHYLDRLEWFVQSLSYSYKYK